MAFVALTSSRMGTGGALGVRGEGLEGRLPGVGGLGGPVPGPAERMPIGPGPRDGAPPGFTSAVPK